MALKNNNFKKLIENPQEPGKYITTDYIVVLHSSPNKKQLIIEGSCWFEGTSVGTIYFGTFEMNQESPTLLKDCHHQAMQILGDGFEIVDLTS